MRPTFIACGARSGSTLLRWLLDAHPEISCPAETDVALALAAHEASERAMWGPQVMSTLRAARSIDDMIEERLLATGKPEWCDKSLSNTLHLDLLARAWPRARFIFLHRHVMDFIASALDAQPWGLSDYGFMPFAARCPGDNVAALARYWVDRTQRMVDFERKTGHPCLQIRYEDLVTEPTTVLGALWEFLEVPEADVMTAAFDGHDVFGNADHHIWYTDGIASPSLGAARVPSGRILPPFRGQVNDLLGQLDYPTIDDAWGSGGTGHAHLRVVRGHEVLRDRDLPNKGMIAVEESVVAPLIDGTLNMGSALRNRWVRYYGPPLEGYGPERDLFERVRKALTEMAA